MKYILLLLTSCCLVSPIFGQGSPPLKVTEVDGSPSKNGVTKIVVSNGTLTIAGSTATIDTSGGGGGTPAGADGDYQINLSGAFAAGILNQSTTGRLTITPTLQSSGVAKYFRLITPVDTGQAASTEVIGAQFGGNTSAATVTRTWATGALATQRENLFVAPTYAFTGASTLATACTVCITAAPIAGTNATITTPLALLLQSGSAEITSGSLFFASSGGIRTQLTTRNVGGIAVPYFRTAPVNGTVSPMAFDIMPNGDVGTGGEAAWIDIVDNDIEAGLSSQYLHIAKRRGSYAEISTTSGDLRMMTTAGNVSIGAMVGAPSDLLHVRGGALLVESGAVANTNIRLAPGGPAYVQVQSGSGKRVFLFQNASGASGNGSAVDASYIWNDSGPFQVIENNTPRFSIASGSHNAYFGNGITAASPAAGAINGVGGSGSNIAGANLSLAGGKHTGTPAAQTTGNVLLQTSLIGAAASTLNSLVDRHIVKAGRTTLTDATDTSMFEVALASNSAIGGKVVATIIATDGTDYQERQVEISWGGVNKAGTITAAAPTIISETANVSAGTLTATWIATAGASKITIKCNADSSLTTTSFYIIYQVVNNSEQAVTIL